MNDTATSPSRGFHTILGHEGVIRLDTVTRAWTTKNLLGLGYLHIERSNGAPLLYSYPSEADALLAIASLRRALAADSTSPGTSTPVNEPDRGTLVHAADLLEEAARKIRVHHTIGEEWPTGLFAEKAEHDDILTTAHAVRLLALR